MSGALREWPVARVLGAGLSVAAAAAGLWAYLVEGRESLGWWCVGIALLLAVAWQWRAAVPAVDAPGAEVRFATGWRVLGAALAVVAAALWVQATLALYGSWTTNFDRTWLTWVAAAAVGGGGLDLLVGGWRRAPRGRRGLRIALILLLTAVAAGYRLWNRHEFPGEGFITQIEDVQVGNFGNAYLMGDRTRWEYIGITWLSALSIALFGPTLFGYRLGLGAVSALKVVPIFYWLRQTAGLTGAVVGAALLAVSAWDIVLSQAPNNQNAIVVATAFALLGGPAARGRPSAYVWLGVIGGYVLHEYVGYRPLALLAIAGATWVSLRDGLAPWPVRVGRPLLTLALMTTMVVPLFAARLEGRVGLEYFDGWYRAREASYYYEPEHPVQAALSKGIERGMRAAGLFFFAGEENPRRIVGKPLLDPLSGVLLLTGAGFALAHWFRPVVILTLAGFAATMFGGLVLTGNFDVARIGGAVPYVFVLAGLGAASLAAVLGRAWGRPGSMLAAVLLAATVAAAAVLNTQTLLEYWSDPKVRAAQFRPLAYLSEWLRRTVGPGEMVVGVAPEFKYLLEFHDGAWLRGPMSGQMYADLQAALDGLAVQPQPALFFVYKKGADMRALADYLRWLLPGARPEVVPGPVIGADLLVVHTDGRHADIRERLPAQCCGGLEAGDEEVETLDGGRLLVPLYCPTGSAPICGENTAGAPPRVR